MRIKIEEMFLWEIVLIGHIFVRIPSPRVVLGDIVTSAGRVDVSSEDYCTVKTYLQWRDVEVCGIMNLDCAQWTIAGFGYDTANQVEMTVTVDKALPALLIGLVLVKWSYLLDYQRVIPEFRNLFNSSSLGFIAFRQVPWKHGVSGPPNLKRILRNHFV